MPFTRERGGPFWSLSGFEYTDDMNFSSGVDIRLLEVEKGVILYDRSVEGKLIRDDGISNWWRFFE